MSIHPPKSRCLLRVPCRRALAYRDGSSNLTDKHIIVCFVSIALTDEKTVNNIVVLLWHVKGTQLS